jgi:beta-lactam-binding protein with PASTA domain
MGAFASHEATVPALVGMTQADAVSALTGAGLQVGSVTYANKPVSGVPDGSVSSQSLAQGSKVDPSTKVDLVLAGSQTVKVPNVVGLTETQATLTLQSAGLAAGTITSVATSTVSPGMVLVQAPAAGADVSHGTAVNLQVSQGSVPVPNVVGVAQSDAEASLKTAGFTVSVTPQGSTSVASGRVISQNPSAGVTAQPGSTVTIVVSTGSDLVVVPNVVTMTQANAVNALTAAGFKSTVTLHTGGGPVGTVISQVPLAGAKAASGSTVAITVAQ